jgi:phosphoglycerol transferase MdoB-like AlkP superfamily enzyme
MVFFVQRTMAWGMGLSVAVPFLGFLLASWFSGTEVDPGPGFGLGVILICGALLVAAYVVVVISGTLFAWSLWESDVQATPMQRYWLGLGTAYVLAGAALLAVMLL